MNNRVITIITVSSQMIRWHILDKYTRTTKMNFIPKLEQITIYYQSSSDSKMTNNT